jgi:opacity protein-like surface antigen
MNRIFKWLLVIILTSHFSLQTLFAQGIQGKFIIGMNAAQVDGDAMYGFNRIGLLIGGGANMKLGKKISLQPEIYYSMKGASSTIYQSYLSTLFHYVDVPVVINFQFAKRWAFQAGLSGCYLVNAQIDGTGYGFIDRTDLFKKYDICFVIGAEFALSPEWGINVRYNYSTVPINSNVNTSQYSISRPWFNNYLNISIRYLFIKRAPATVK